jgi:hypothetical protein
VTADDAAEQFAGAAREAMRSGALDGVSDDAMRQVLTAVVKLYSAKCEAAAAEIVPFAPEDVTPTEAVTLACGVIRGAGLNLFDVAMWFGRQTAGL